MIDFLCQNTFFLIRALFLSIRCGGSRNAKLIKIDTHSYVTWEDLNKHRIFEFFQPQLYGKYP